jgi:von Willebrand factor type A domain.
MLKKLQPLLFLLVTLFMITACGKEEVYTNPNPGKFTRLETIGMNVIPKDREVQILFRATDFDGQGISGITVDDLEVFENGGSIDREGDLTITRDSIPFDLRTVLLLDLTRSVEGLVPQIKAACIAMINQKLPEQQIAIYTFDSNTELLQNFTADKAALIAAINIIPEVDLVNSTNLYGAIQEMEGLWNDVYSIDGIEDGSLIIFTDGRHNATQNITLTDALRAIDGKKRFVAALSSPDLDEASLKILAESDDRYFKAADVNGLQNMFLNIQEEIQKSSNSIYYMYYQSPITDPSPFENTLRVEVKNNTNNLPDAFIEETFNSEGFN